MRFVTCVCTSALSVLCPCSAQAQAPNLAVGETVQAVGKTYAFFAASPSAPAIGSEAPGNQGVVIAGPANNPYTQWQVAFNDNLTGWVYQGSLAPASPGAPILSFSANPADVVSGGSSTLSWTSTNAMSCTGVGFSPRACRGLSPSR
jgi:hypothetical protein